MNIKYQHNFKTHFCSLSNFYYFKFPYFPDFFSINTYNKSNKSQTATGTGMPIKWDSNSLKLEVNNFLTVVKLAILAILFVF